MSSLRCFIAILLPSDVRGRIGAVIKTLQSIPSEVRWEHPDKLHMTLKFLGSIGQPMLQPLEEELRDHVHNLAAFDITFTAVGGFPSVDHPRVLWVGSRENAFAKHLARVSDDAAARIGVKREDREFHPHVTIGRVKAFHNIERLTATLKSLTFEPITTRCELMHIMRSELTPSGSRYTVVTSIPLIS